MSSAHDDLLRRADEFMEPFVTYPERDDTDALTIIRALRDALVAADALPDAVRLDKMRLAKLDEIIDDLTEMRAFLAAHKPLETTLTATASRVDEVEFLSERLQSAEAKIARVENAIVEFGDQPLICAEIIGAALADAESEEPHA